MKSDLHRSNVFDLMRDKSILISYAGIPLHTNEDEYAPFDVNSNFFWLTGSSFKRQVLVLVKNGDIRSEKLFIEPSDAHTVRWTGHMPSVDEMNEISGIDEEDIAYIADMKNYIGRQIDYQGIENAYLDTYQYDASDLADFAHERAVLFRTLYPHVWIHSLRTLIGPLRKIKDEDEIEDIRHAISITDQALKDMLMKLKPGMKEYQAQSIFEASCYYQGAEKLSFPTIAAAGINACSMHYSTNRDEIRHGDLVLFDLGAKYNNYCSDISRTYPADGIYTPRQKELYNIVLKANKAVRQAARPGITLRDLNDTASKVLADELMQIGLIDDSEEISRYYMHGVSHFIGIDCHDIMINSSVLEPGCVISDEPGLYIDEEQTGIRIEDDLLITEDGCECLSEGVMRDPDEIEAFIQENR